MTRDALATRINARVDGMRTAGLAEEVERLRDAPGGLSRTAAQAIGYKELLDRPVDREAAFALIAQRTRQFARRQRMWFRRDERIVWVAGDENASARLGLVLALWDRARPQVYA